VPESKRPRIEAFPHQISSSKEPNPSHPLDPVTRVGAFHPAHCSMHETCHIGNSISQYCLLGAVIEVSARYYSIMGSMHVMARVEWHACRGSPRSPNGRGGYAHYINSAFDHRGGMPYKSMWFEGPITTSQSLCTLA
jgi:hypothetical protein